MQVHAAEHYAEGHQPWTCAAAPLRDPVTGRVLGVVDLSGPASTVHPSTIALVDAVACEDTRNTGNLLPNVESTFSWVRLAQRIPVRIHVDRMPPGARLEGVDPATGEPFAGPR